MRTLLLTLAFLIAFAPDVHAQGNEIVVVNPDGSVERLQIGPSPSVVRKDSKPAAAPAPAAPAAAKPAPSQAPAAKPIKKPAPQKQAVKKEVPAKKETPVKQKKESKKVDQKKPARAATASVPEPMSPRPSAAPTRQRLGPYMTPEDAIRIALDVAPPAISVTASPVNFKGLHAYEVIFKTENGNRHIYVDRESGKPVK